MAALFVFSVVQCVIGVIFTVLGIVDRIQAPGVGWGLSYLLLPVINGILILLCGALGIAISQRKFPKLFMACINMCIGLSISCTVVTSILISNYIDALASSGVLSGSFIRYDSADGLEENPSFRKTNVQLLFSNEEKQHTATTVLLYVLGILELVVSLSMAMNCLAVQWRCHVDFSMGTGELQSVVHGNVEDPSPADHRVLRRPHRGNPETASYTPLTESPVQSRHQTDEDHI